MSNTGRQSVSIAAESPWLTPLEAALYARLASPLRLYGAVRMGALKAAQFGGSNYRFRREWIDAWLSGDVDVDAA